MASGDILLRHPQKRKQQASGAHSTIPVLATIVIEVQWTGQLDSRAVDSTAGKSLQAIVFICTNTLTCMAGVLAFVGMECLRVERDRSMCIVLQRFVCTDQLPVWSSRERLPPDLGMPHDCSADHVNRTIGAKKQVKTQARPTSAPSLLTVQHPRLCCIILARACCCGSRAGASGIQLIVASLSPLAACNTSHALSIRRIISTLFRPIIKGSSA